MKSDDEGDGGKTNINLNLLRPPSVSLAQDLIDDNSLLNDNLLKADGVGDDDGEKEIDDDADLLEDDDVEMLGLQSAKQMETLIDDDDDSDDDDDEEVDEELKTIKEFDSILKELEINQYAYDKYVRLCELSQ